MINCYYDILSTIQFSEDVPLNEIQAVLAEHINYSMTFDEQLKELHEKSIFKYYVFSAPYPLEVDHIYHKGRMYCFNLRTLDLKFALKMKHYLRKAKGIVRVVSSELNNFSLKPIKELITLTPIVCTVSNRCWMPENGIGLLSERLNANVIKKLKNWDSSLTIPEEYFFDHIEVLNKKPILMSYKGKGTVLLGHKICLKVKPNPWAQQMAVTALAAGVLEKNSLGFGYCIAGR